MKIAKLAITCMLGVSFFSLSANADRTYNFPKVDGYRVDWCYNWAQGCGKKAANRFCQLKGFLKATNWQIDDNIGLSSTTMTLGDRKKCNKNFCDGFKYISCKPLPHPLCVVSKKFKYPKINHTRVDWCHTWGTNCGKKAANVFCKRKGYIKALDWKIDQNIGLQSSTITLGDHRYCDKGFCDGFKDIVCGR